MKQAKNINLASWQETIKKATPLNILSSGPIDVSSFRELLQFNAEIISRNPRYSIFYRGQSRQYFDRNGLVSILPSIYRNVSPWQNKKVETRFRMLGSIQEHVRKVLEDNDEFDATSKLVRTVSCWAIIQHYGLCYTPLIDVTQSLRVACAFALQEDNDVPAGEGPTVYDIALPYSAGPLTLDDNEELYLMKLDALMPSLALRPFIQESYLVGDELISRGVKDIAGADLRRRVIASFRLCGDKGEWTKQIGFDAGSLMVVDDRFSDLRRKEDETYKNINWMSSENESLDNEELVEAISGMLMQFAHILKTKASE